jgi:hypothetical protein
MLQAQHTEKEKKYGEKSLAKEAEVCSLRTPQ